MTHNEIKQNLTSRRAVLGGMAAGLGVVLVGPASQATAAGSTVTVAPLPGRTSVATSAKSVVQVPTLLGAELKVTTRAVRAGSTVALAFDGRLYRTNPPILTTAAGELVACRLTRTLRGSTPGSKTVTLTLDEALVPGESYLLSLGSRRLVRYPDDIVPSPLPIQVTVADQTGGPSSRKLAAAPEAEHAVWGLKLGVGWQAVYWGEGFHSWIPELITIAATGPTDVPAGTVVSATLDARLFSRAWFEALVGRTSPSPRARRFDDVLRAQWHLRQPLAAGRRISVRLTADTLRPSGPLTDLHPPTVTARAAGVAVGQRTTGLESASREDSAYDFATRSTYGLDLASPLRPK